ncbi:MAG: DUF2336 domain-containing protein [Xanthobacteraceae bacterium]
MIAQTTLVNELEDALRHGTPKGRADILHYVTDLFIFGSSEYSNEQIAVFDDVFNRLAATIEVSARVILATRLAKLPNAPPIVIQTLAFDDAIDVAVPVLMYSQRLREAALVDNARTKSQQHLLAISQRKSLSEPVTDVLVERGDQRVVRSTVENVGAKFSDSGYATLVSRSGGDEGLAVCLGSRGDIPRHHFLKLLAKASEAVRNKLEAANCHPAREIQTVVAEVAKRIQAKTEAESKDYLAACAHVDALRATGRLDESAVEAFARAGKFEETTASLAVLCDLPIAVVERAMIQDRAELALIFAKAVGLSWRTAKAILLLRTGQGRISPHEIERGVATFERLKRATAQQVVRFQRTRQHAAMPPAER